jgi:hypothetical protein
MPQHDSGKAAGGSGDLTAPKRRTICRRRARPRCPPAVLFWAAVRRNHFPIAAKPSGNNHPLGQRTGEWCFMSSSFHNADRRTYRKVMVVGLLFCMVFVVFSFFAREQPANTYVLKKADRLVRTAGSAVPAN